MTQENTCIFTDEILGLGPFLSAGWSAEDVMNIARKGVTVMVSGLYIVSRSGVRVVSISAVTVLAVLTKMGMVHEVEEENGAVTGGVPTSRTTPEDDSEAFMVMAGKSTRPSTDSWHSCSLW